MSSSPHAPRSAPPTPASPPPPPSRPSSTPPPVPPIDRLSGLLERFRVRAQLFHTGPLCGVTPLDAQPGRGFLHVLRRGELVVTHRRGPAGRGLPVRLALTEPSLLFYPHAAAHVFHTAPRDGADFTCASVHFDGDGQHPLVRALPPLVHLPLAAVPGLDASLALLFQETGQPRCGQRLLADRLFEVVLLQLLRWLLDHPEAAGLPPGLLQGLSDPALARTLTALHESPGAAWTLPRMAATAGLSRSVFAARFRAVLDATPADYLAQWRVLLAQQRLRDGHSVKQVAADLGYANASALSRLFTQKTGRPPRHWRAAPDRARA